MPEWAASLGFVPDWPLPAGVNAFVTTRDGGHSPAPYASNNLALHVGDDPGCVQRNRRQLSHVLQLPNEPQWLRQVHGDRVIAAGADGVVREADGSISTEAGTICAVLTADCLPILLCDRGGTEVAAIHAGWRGLAAGIIARAVTRFAPPGEDLSAYIGPAICRRCYEIDDNVRRQLLNTLTPGSFRLDDITQPVADKAGHHLISLTGVATAQLNQLGVSQVFGGDICNSCDSRFFSYRRDRMAQPQPRETGRFATLIWRR